MSTVDQGSMSIKVHPLVVMNIADHCARASKDRVIGTLFGTQTERGVDVLESLEVAWGLDAAGNVEISLEAFEDDMKLFKSAYSMYECLGWYSTGDKPRPDDIELHQLMKKYNERPLYMLLDPKAKPDRDLPVSVFIEEAYVDKGIANVLAKTKFEIVADEAYFQYMDQVWNLLSGEELDSLSSPNAILGEVDSHMSEPDFGSLHLLAGSFGGEPTFPSLAFNYAESETVPMQVQQVDDVGVQTVGAQDHVTPSEVQGGGPDNFDNVIDLLELLAQMPAIEGLQELRINLLELLAQTQVLPPNVESVVTANQPQSTEPQKRKRTRSSLNYYCRNKRQREIRFLDNQAPPPKKHLTAAQRQHILSELKNKTADERIQIFGSRERFFGARGWTARKIWEKGDDGIRDIQIGRPPKLSDQKLNELFTDACGRYEAGVGFSPQTFKERIINEAEIQAAENQTSPASARTIDNYIGLLKQTGLKLVKKPQIHDLRCSFRNVASTFAVATVTHADVCEEFIFNIDPATLIYGYVDNSLCAAVVPIATDAPVCLLGNRPVSFCQQLKLLPMTSFAGNYGPLIILVKVAKKNILDGSSIVKVPVLGCHPGGFTGLGTHLWFVADVKPAEVVAEVLKDHFPPFFAACRAAVARFGVVEERGVLWIDCGKDMTEFLASPEGVKWAQDLKLCVNIHASKYTGVGQQSDLSPSSRGKQVVKCHSYQSSPMPQLLQASFEKGISGKLRLGKKKGPLLAVLAQIFQIIPKSFWIEHLKKGWECFRPMPKLDNCMRMCDDYKTANDAEKERLQDIVAKCVQQISNHAEITDCAFDEMGAPSDAIDGFPCQRAQCLTPHALPSNKQRKLGDEKRQKKTKKPKAS